MATPSAYPRSDQDRAPVVTIGSVADFRGVELARTGTFELFAGGRRTFTAEDFSDAIEASRDADLGRPIIKPGHVDDRFDRQGEPALGVVENMRVDGDRLVGDYVGVPGWLAATMRTAYPNRSIEGYAGVTTPAGKTYRLVVTGVAMLGVTPPAMTGLADLPASVAAASDSPVRLCATLADMGLLRHRSKSTPVAAALSSTVAQEWTEVNGGPDRAPWIVDTEIGLDPAPDAIIVRNYPGDTLCRVTFTEDPGGAITFGDPVEVITTYVQAPSDADDVAAAAGNVRPPTDPTGKPADRDPLPQGDPVDVKALAEALGTPDETDEAKLLDGLRAVATERAELKTKIAAAAAPPPGTAVIDAAKLAELQIAAAAGTDALARVKADARSRFIAGAQGAGKLAPASKELAASLGELYDTDPARAEKVVAEMPAVIPTSPAGHGGSATGNETPNGFGTPEEEALFASFASTSPLLANAMAGHTTTGAAGHEGS